MSRRADPQRGEPTDYEAEQVRRIAAWKSQPPNPLAELWTTLTLPAARAVEKLIPDRLAGWTVERILDTADLLAGQEDIKRSAGVRDLAELRGRPMEECDRMARQVGLGAMAVATAEGAATGAGGAWTTLLDVPLLFGLALRTIYKIGHCYGYPLDGDGGRALALATLVTALSGSLEVRRQRLRRLREFEEMVFDEAEEEVLTQEVLSFLFQIEAFEEIPGVGALSGAALNLALIRRVDVAARRVFQERWLRGGGKIEGYIEPAEAHPRALAPGISGALGRLAYSGCYSVVFGVAVPFYASAAVLRPAGDAVARGVGRAASRAQVATASLIPGRRPAPALSA
ncbi:EcsC protein family protein [Aquisphaera giovannonii]|uniref:EcsC protein family protein n=1 Tax=Aquisphaera giovannonii TaxID=406548 RepID=A0A5B9W1H6_9BACT|nr:EcsC family protein [Aquisphaera giovannonii]QEH34502.1 EcsC protein family protein [Aquisphaera giovannonii]